MKIDNSLGFPGNLEIKKEHPKPAPSEPEARPEEAGDVVKLSEYARLASRATELAMSAPEVRQEKVAGIKASLTAGTYNVNAQMVAEALLRKSITEV